jgi:hypothetical protein
MGGLLSCDRATNQHHDYDAAWRKLRRRFLDRNPVCCEPGCMQPATEVDHRDSIRERPDLRLAELNLCPYCKRHHSARTAREQGFARPGGGAEKIAVGESQARGGDALNFAKFKIFFLLSERGGGRKDTDRNRSNADLQHLATGVLGRGSSHPIGSQCAECGELTCVDCTDARNEHNESKV